jgi:hypothetical protein
LERGVLRHRAGGFDAVHDAQRRQLAARLESEELYEDALPVLEWLTSARPDDGGYRNRLAATRHALKLKADINGR